MEEFSEKIWAVVSQNVKAGKKEAVGTVIGYSVSKGPKKATPTPAPTSNKNYKYVGSVSISSNPFDYPEDDPAVIELVLNQDGKKKTVFSGTLSYNDFPSNFTVIGWSDNNGTISMGLYGEVLGGEYNIAFSKVSE